MSAKPGSSRGASGQVSNGGGSPEVSQKAGATSKNQDSSGFIDLKPMSAAGSKGQEQRLNTASPSRHAPL